MKNCSIAGENRRIGRRLDPREGRYDGRISPELRKLNFYLRVTMSRRSRCTAYLRFLDAQDGSKEEKAAYDEWIRLAPNRFAEMIIERLDETEIHQSENADIYGTVDWAAGEACEPTQVGILLRLESARRSRARNRRNAQ
jgi:hypothetical protein